MNQDVVNKSVLLILVVAISALFFSMIHQFLMAIFLAGLFSALARPVYRRLNILYNGVTQGWYPSLIFLGIGMVIPFIIATSCIVIASGHLFHGKPYEGVLENVNGQVASLVECGRLRRVLALVEARSETSLRGS